MSNQDFQYRADIDGLRAIAVLSVVIYHAFPHQFPGGFAGVDIFFVISGFLITSILRKEIATGTFSIRMFYMRRVRRLFPALVVVLLFALIAGWALLLRHEFLQLGWHVVAGTGFFSNIALWSEAGYFDTESHLKPLLHLWSLGVEEQFYIVWPLVLFLIIRFKLNFYWFISLLIGLSFILGVRTLSADPTSAFYLPFYRFWELMLGGLIAGGLSSNRDDGRSSFIFSTSHQVCSWVRNLVALFGVALILIGLNYLDKSKQFPGFWALFSVVGSTLLIISGPSTIVSKYVLANKWMVGIGLISYPLYLWHWPILVFARIVEPNGIDPIYRIGLLLLAFILAWATYRWLEQPLRGFRSGTSARVVSIALIAMMLFLFCFGLLIKNGVVKERLQQVSSVLSDAVEDWDWPQGEETYIKGDSEEIVLLFGDSYIAQLWPRVEKLTADAHGNHPNIVIETVGGCAPLTGLGRVGKPECLTYVNKGLELANKKEVSTIIIGSAWKHLMHPTAGFYDVFSTAKNPLNLTNSADLEIVLSKLERQLSDWKSKGKNVYIVLNPPGDKIANPSVFLNRLKLEPSLHKRQITKGKYIKRFSELNTLIRDIAEKHEVIVIDPSELICSEYFCDFSDEQGIPYFIDSTHMRAFFVRENYYLIDKIITPGN